MVLRDEGGPLERSLTSSSCRASLAPSVNPNMLPEIGAVRIGCCDDFANALRRASTSSRFTLMAAAFSALRKLVTAGYGNTRRWVHTGTARTRVKDCAGVSTWFRLTDLAPLVALECFPSVESPYFHAHCQAIRKHRLPGACNRYQGSLNHTKSVSFFVKPLGLSPETPIRLAKATIVTKQYSPLSCRRCLPTSCSLPLFAFITTDNPTNSFFVPPFSGNPPPRQISPSADSRCSCRPLLPHALEPAAAKRAGKIRATYCKRYRKHATRWHQDLCASFLRDQMIF